MSVSPNQFLGNIFANFKTGSDAWSFRASGNEGIRVLQTEFEPQSQNWANLDPITLTAASGQKITFRTVWGILAGGLDFDVRIQNRCHGHDLKSGTKDELAVRRTVQILNVDLPQNKDANQVFTKLEDIPVP